jgi:hypothetical protein
MPTQRKIKANKKLGRDGRNMKLVYSREESEDI